MSKNINSEPKVIKTTTEVKETIEPTVDPNKKEKWGTSVEFLLTCLSFVIGFGNIWRFPYICYKNGGGAFLIPYILSLLFIGLPLMILEMTLGQYSARGKIMVWKFMPIFQGIGISMFIIVSIQAVYYNVLVGWSIFYFYSSFTFKDLPWSKCGHSWNTPRCTNGSLNSTYRSPSDEFFHEQVLQINENMEDITTLNWKIVICLLIAWLMIFLTLSRGLKSMGKVSYLTTIFPYICLIILFIRGLFLPGAYDGIKYYITPDWRKLLVASVWVDASQQIFFSLGVSWGIIITLSSYNNFDNHLIRDALIIAFGNSFTSIFAGFVIFSYMGSIAYDRNVDISKVATQGPGLTFIMYPEAVAKFPFGQVFAILFFAMLISLGLGSMTPNIESILAAIFDYRPEKRASRALMVGIISYLCFFLGLIYCSYAGMYWFNLFSGFCGSTSAMIIGLVEIVVISWVYGIDKFMDHIKEMVGRYPFPRLYWRICFLYITPTALTVLLILSLINSTEPKYREYEYPKWSVYLGWFINLGSVLPIPIVAIYYLYQCYKDKYSTLKEVSTPNVVWKTPDHEVAK